MPYINHKQSILSLIPQCFKHDNCHRYHRSHWISLITVFLYVLIIALYSTPVLSANKNPEMTVNTVVNQLLEEYQANGAGTFSPLSGGNLWRQSFGHSKTPTQRSCTDCHGKIITQTGTHVRTNRVIEPLAPSVNPERLSSKKKIRKWLKRNCKWTLGRECSPQEKGDLLLWIQSQ